MCTHDHQIDRRSFGGLLLGAGALALLPGKAWAADAALGALVLTCIDYRTVAPVIEYCDKTLTRKNYDEVVLAGASLAAVSPVFPAENKAFWNQLEIARGLHNVQKLVVIDHRECGAYKKAFGANYAEGGDDEKEQHRSVMASLKVSLLQQQPKLPVEFYLMTPKLPYRVEEIRV